MARRFVGASLAVLVLALMPLSAACYAERVESCRDPMSDFADISAPLIVNPTRLFAFESATPAVAFILSATTTRTDGAVCIAVRSELRDSRGGLIEVLDTPIRGSIRSGVLTTTSIFHYHQSSLAPMTVHVTALGTTLDATVTDSRFSDAAAFVADAGLRATDAATLPDVGTESDAALDLDAGVDPDAEVDADVDAAP